jgi:hypothetical protein
MKKYVVLTFNDDTTQSLHEFDSLEYARKYQSVTNSLVYRSDQISKVEDDGLVYLKIDDCTPVC